MLTKENYSELRKAMEENASNVENLVFAGGGAKCMCYLGVIKVLEDVGILKKIKRFAGSSTGSIAAAMLALGCDSSELDKFFMKADMNELLQDCTAGKLGLIPNLFIKFGWNPGTKLLDAVRKILEDKTGNPDLTFKQLYQKTGLELCVVATNLTTSVAEYCHPKTTPDMSVALAVKASCSSPGLVQPVKLEKNGVVEYLVDGGLISNFPIHCFDGWFLSMETEYSFFHHLETVQGPFEDFNEKTLGVIAFAGTEYGALNQSRVESFCRRNQRPKTKLAEINGKEVDKGMKQQEDRQKAFEAGKRLLAALKEADLNRDGSISLDEYKKAFIQDGLLSDEDGKLLFGPDFDFNKAFDLMDRDTSGSLTIDEFLSFMQGKGVSYHSMLLGGCSNVYIDGFTGYLNVAFRTLQCWSDRIFSKPRDPERIISVCTDYVQTMDISLEKDDKMYLYKIGIEAAAEFLKDRADKNEAIRTRSPSISEEQSSKQSED